MSGQVFLALRPAERLIELARKTPPMRMVYGAGRAYVQRGKADPSRSDAELRREVLWNACHEAGHAVADASLYSDGVVRFTTIEHEGDLHGYTERLIRRDRPPINLPGTPVQGEEAQRAIALGVSAYSGAACELFAPFSPESREWKAGRPMASPLLKRYDASSLSDRVNLERLAAGLCKLRYPSEEIHLGLLNRTREFLVPRWHVVYAVAAELCAHGRLEGERVEEIVRGAEQR